MTRYRVHYQYYSLGPHHAHFLSLLIAWSRKPFLPPKSVERRHIINYNDNPSCTCPSIIPPAISISPCVYLIMTIVFRHVLFDAVGAVHECNKPKLSAHAVLPTIRIPTTLCWDLVQTFIMCVNCLHFCRMGSRHSWGQHIGAMKILQESCSHPGLQFIGLMKWARKIICVKTVASVTAGPTL